MVSVDFVVSLAMAMMDGEWGVVDAMLHEVEDERIGDVLELGWVAQGMVIADAESEWMNAVLDDMISDRYNTGNSPVEFADGRVH